MPVLVTQGKIVPEGKDSSSDNGEQGDANGQQQQTNPPTTQETQGETTVEKEETKPATLPLTDNKVSTEEEGAKEPAFPLDILASLDEQLNRPRWVVPVLPKSDLETLLEVSIKLAREGLDVKSEPCQRFFRDGLSLSFVRVLDDDAVNAWNPDIQSYILTNTKLLVELCAVKVDQDWFPLMELLARALNPNCKWNNFNREQKSEWLQKAEAAGTADSLFSCSPDDKEPRGWLCDLINIFGDNGGFEAFHAHLCSGRDALSVTVIAAQIRPFANCIDYIAEWCVKKFIAPVVNKVFEFLDGLNDEALKKESSTEAKGDTMSSIMKSLRQLTRRVTTEYDIVQLRLKMILRLLKIASFSGKMNALNEINKVIPGHVYPTTMHYHSSYEDESQLTPDKMATWIKENKVLEVVLRDNLHQPQYVEKLEKMLRFCIREKVLTIEDLDTIWASQDGKHEAIVKNIYDVLAKLAWDFSPEQLDHLFNCFQRSWVHAAKKQRDELLEFIRRLAEDDKDGVMANKVLDMLWTLAKREDCPPDTLDHALNAHIKILDFSCAQDRDNRKMKWLLSCIGELELGKKWVIPALKHFRDVCSLYPEPPPQFHYSRSTYIYYRTQVLQHIDQEHHILSKVIESLQDYMDLIRTAKESDGSIEPETYCVDDRYNHFAQVQNRVDFIRFVLRDGNLWLGISHALSVWKCLAEFPVFPSDREACLKWFSKLVSDEPDLEPDTVKHMFIENVMKLSPNLLTDNGFRCFDRFFRHVNYNDNKLRQWRRTLMTDRLDLMGLDYLWDVILTGQQGIANKAIELMKEIYTNLTPQLKEHNVPQEFLKSCFDRMQRIWASLVAYKKGEFQEEEESKGNKDGYQRKVVELTRCLAFLREYAAEVDDCYPDERAYPPHGKASWGRAVMIRIQYSHTRGVDEFELASHANETMAAVRRHIKQQLKLPPTSHLEVSCGADIILPQEDHKHVALLAQRDRVTLQVKVMSLGTNVGDGSSQESSSDSDRVSPQFEGPNLEHEKGLPSVIMAQTKEYIEFLLQVGEFAVEDRLPKLRETVRELLQLIPSEHLLVSKLLNLCSTQSKVEDREEGLGVLVKEILDVPPLKALYNLEVVQSLLMPANEFRDNECRDFQLNFVLGGGIELLIGILSNEERLAAIEIPVKRTMLMCTIHMCRQMLLAQGYMRIYHVSARLKADPASINEMVHKKAVQLQTTLQHHILPQTETKLRESARTIAQFIHTKVPHFMVDPKTMERLCHLIWSSQANDVSKMMAEPSVIHQAVREFFGSGLPLDTEIASLLREAFEVLSIFVALDPYAFSELMTKTWWNSFVLDSLTRTKNRYLRMAASDQIFIMAAQCSGGPEHILALINLLIRSQQDVASGMSSTSSEYFKLLAKLLNHAISTGTQLPDMSQFLERELKWIKDVQIMYEKGDSGHLDAPLIEGHLNLTVELINALPIAERYTIGSKEGGMELIRLLVEKYLFPASVLLQRMNKDSCVTYDEQVATAICSTGESMAAAFRVITALCTGSLENLKAVYSRLQELFYSSGSDMTLTDWEYFPHLGPRPIKGFVGLRNAGATCYMNSVMQQLYMVPDIRKGVLEFHKVSDLHEDVGDDDEKPVLGPLNRKESGEVSPMPSPSATNDGDNRKDTNRRIVMQLQSIFAHLLLGKLQAHTPRGFWKDFKLWGEKVNLREQHDAFEFFNCLVDNVDEGIKSYECKPLVSSILGGLFADQKICKECPHRYTRTEPFTALNIGVRFQHTLYESLDAFVQGELLEGNNKYHCEKCNKKVDTVKRMCIKKLPKVLVFQLKRFDYDWEREMAVKFNDYFEFPRELDMATYTAAHKAKIEGEVIEDDNQEVNEEVEKDGEGNTEYVLRGVVVHSGQASGGHYYSFIRYKPPGSSISKWYRFDDSDVTEWKMDDDEELKSQCFGGEYTGEVYDQDLRRSQFRRQKRWWSAYLLFYERKDYTKELESHQKEAVSSEVLPVINSKVQSAVLKRNLRFSHHKSHFNHTYYTFIKQVLGANATIVKSRMDLLKGKEASDEMIKLALLCTQLATEFLFNVGFRTKRNLRGPANDWVEPLCTFLTVGPRVREWFANYGILRHPPRLCEYLLECPSAEIRNSFARLLLTVCQEANKDAQPYAYDTHFLRESESPKSVFSYIVLSRLLELLKKEVPHFGRHLQQYFSFFMAYAFRSKTEFSQLLQLDVPILFMGVSLDEGPGPPIRTPYVDLSKLYPTVTSLVCCYDVTPMQKSNSDQGPPRINPFRNQELQIPLQEMVTEMLYRRPQSSNISSNYLKKVIDENASGEDTIKLLKFLVWENWEMSLVVLNELVTQLSTCQVIETRQYTDLLMHIAQLDDSWMHRRLVVMLKGQEGRVEGLVAIIQEAKARHHKKAYLAIKFLVNLFHESQLAVCVLHEDADLKQLWQYAIKWLRSEMDRKSYSTSYPYSNWSPPAQSNELTNGYFLERSNSALLTLDKAYQVLPPEPEEVKEDTIVPGGDPDAGIPAAAAAQHGIERPGAPQPEHQISQTSQTTEGSSNLDNIDEEDATTTDLDATTTDQDSNPPLGTDRSISNEIDP